MLWGLLQFGSTANIAKWASKNGIDLESVIQILQAEGDLDVLEQAYKLGMLLALLLELGLDSVPAAQIVAAIQERVAVYVQQSPTLPEEFETAAIQAGPKGPYTWVS